MTAPPAPGPTPVTDPIPDAERAEPPPLLMVLPTAAMVALGVAVMVASRPLYDFSERAAANLLGVQPYLDAVLR